MARKVGVIQLYLSLLILIVVFIIPLITTLITDYWWFGALGFSSIFLISLKTKVALFFIGAAIFLIFASINLWISSKIKTTTSDWLKIKILIAMIISVFFGLSLTSEWMTVLQFFNQIDFNIIDPIFYKDVSFYVFSLPFFMLIWKFALACVIITLIFVALDYVKSELVRSLKKPEMKPQVVNGEVPSFKFKPEFKLKKPELVHMAILGSIVFIIFAIGNYLSRFNVMFSEKGIVVGAGFTDVHIVLPVINFLIVFAIIVAVLFYLWIFFFSDKKIKKRHILGFGIGMYFVFLVLGSTVLPGIIQKLVVDPNEMNLEKPYLENNINFTRIAYGLDNVIEKDFKIEELTYDIVEKGNRTINNVRILDYRPLTKTYKQTQEIRLYYDLSGIDIDRYDIDGKYTQVMIAPREMNQNRITENAKTWMNLHMVYTHGMGVVVSPVNSVTEQGLPHYFVKDIPPIYTVNESSLEITRPQVYYGEHDNDFVLVNSKTKEFDYPKGNMNEYINYDGKGGIKIDSFTKKLLLAMRFVDIKILFSTEINDETKVMFQRNIKERIKKITPFLELDADPYIVISEGELYWMQDAYTTTDKFPYSYKLGPINYVRNSVKIVVDAYDGDVTYYMMDEEPLMQVYANIYPDQFKNFSDMPIELKKHIRYPEDLFKVQSAVYSLYHMEDTTVFYNKEDAWDIPNEIYGVGEQTQMEPYYIIIKLPDSDKEEFVLMSPFTPIKKDNMVSWFAASSDGENYGNLLLYKFPKDKLMYGPSQIEAKIDQDSEISQQITLWSQQGSRVTRGNLLVIPLNNSIIYIEPLYIESERGQLPELKRILVSDGEKVVMEKTLAEAINSLFGKVISEEKVNKVITESSNETLVDQANIYYENILNSMESKDWSGIGDNLDRLGEVLSELKEEN